MAIVQPPQTDIRPMIPTPVGTSTGGQIFGGIALGIGGILAQMQRAKENAFRQKELETQASQQQALQRYYEGLIQAEQDKAAYERGQTGAIGAGVQQMYGGALPPGQQQVSPPQGGGPITPQRGNMTQTMQGGMTAPPPPMAPQRGQQTQGMPAMAPQAAPPQRGNMTAGMTPPAPPMPPLPGGPPTLDTQNDGVTKQIDNEASRFLSPDGTDHSIQRIINGMPASAVPGFVDELGKLRELQKPLEPTPEEQRNFAFYESLPEPFKTEFYEKFIKKTPGVQISLGDKVAEAGAKKYQEGEAENLIAMQKEVRTEFSGLSGIKQSHRLVANDKAVTGFGANQRLWLARMAASAGMDYATAKVMSTQELLKYTGDKVLGYLRGRDLGSGNAVSDKDRDFMRDLAGQNITLTREALMKIFRINMGTSLFKAQEYIREARLFGARNASEGPDIERRIKEVEQRMAGEVKDYTMMLAEEGDMSAEELRDHLRNLPGGQEAYSRYMKGLADKRKSIRAQADSIHWAPPPSASPYDPQVIR